MKNPSSPEVVQETTELPTRKIDAPLLAIIGEMAARLPNHAVSESGRTRVANDLESARTTVTTFAGKSHGDYSKRLIIDRNPNTGDVQKIERVIEMTIDDGFAFVGAEVERVSYPPEPSARRLSLIKTAFIVGKAHLAAGRPKSLLESFVNSFFSDERSTGPY